MTATFDNFIDGRWKCSRTGQTFEDENPAAFLGMIQFGVQKRASAESDITRTR